MSTVLPSLPVGKSSVHLPATHNSNPKSQDWLAQLLASADIHLNGSRPWDIQIKHPQTLQRLLSLGGFALGESYMDGWWECQAIDLMIERAMCAGLQEKLATPRAWWESFKGRMRPRDGVGQSRIVGRMHYAVGNQVFQAMLDPYMAHSCAYWVEGAQTLEEAQIANAKVNSMADVWAHPQLKSRDRWVKVDSPTGELPALLPPGQQSAFDYRMDAIPNVGQHTQAILNELGMTLD